MQIVHFFSAKCRRLIVSSMLTAALLVSSLTCGICFAATSYTSAQISANKTSVYQYLKNAGYNDAVACGIMASIGQESGFIPNNVQDTFEKSSGYTDATYTAAVDNGTYKAFATDSVGYGLVAWTYSGYKSALYKLSVADGTSVGDLNTQMKYLVSLLKSSTFSKYFSNIPNTAEGAYTAGYNFSYYFEYSGGGASTSASRGNLAKNTYWPAYAGTSTQSSSSSYTTGTYKTTCDLNIRSGSDKTYSSIGVASAGTTWTVTAVANTKWGKITYKGSTGWISLKYCTLVSSTASSGSSSTGSSSSGTTYKTTASTLSLRSGAGTGYKLLCELPKGTVITITSVSGNWGKTTYNGMSGYVYMGYCQKVTTSTGTTYKITATSLNVRSSASTSASILGRLYKGSTVTVTSVSNGWGKISYNGKTGYISMDYCSKVN